MRTMWTMSTIMHSALSTDIVHQVDRFMRRLHASVHSQSHEFDTEMIGQIGCLLLLTLADIQPARIHEVVQQMQRDKSQITRSIKVLEANGLIKRQQCPEDARVRMIALTEKGQGVVRAFRRSLSEILEEILSPLNQEEQRVFQCLLQKL
ncbi:MAG: hypothetical protein CMM78_01840 [Rhodospirillaceae bacterium]|nr:hypothetical protein [Rhodospirillales bacterium]MAX46927.1 hypothetical protein [Rhodospirillaceae bacterium]